MKIAAKELRTSIRWLLDVVARGEEITITYRGKPRARLIAIDSDQKGGEQALTDTPLFGIWSDRKDIENIEGYVDRLRQSRY